ncbi:MAG TPA: sialidase family protein [Actinomycetota bacterium]|nr:sialidase family protein [Actinomycetota bacterium]
MRRPHALELLLVSLVVLIASVTAVWAAAAPRAPLSPLANVDVSQRVGNESEEAVAVNPTNPNNIVIFTNIAEGVSGMFLAVSFDGGKTWNRRIVGEGNDVFGDTCCDSSLSFDEHGNLFMTYLYNTENSIPVALSTDGGLTFHIVANIDSSGFSKSGSKSGRGAAGERRGLFRFVDQPTITSGHGEVWVVFNAGGPLVTAGAPVTGLGQVGAFSAREVVPGTNNCTYGDIAIGPSGQVMQVCTLTESGQGGGKLFVNLDRDGLGPATFGDRVFVADTHIGGFDFIPPQSGRSVDAEPGLAWDRTGGPHNGRVYLVYATENKNESDDTDVMVRRSDNNGATWSSAVRVNHDTGDKSQFLPKISLDPTTGNLAVSWYDSRADNGVGAGDTDGLVNTDAQYWAGFSTDGGATFSNRQVSVGTSNAADAHNGIDYGDYSAISFLGGVAHPAWADNSNSTGNNPDGTLHKFDIYTDSVPV